MHTRLIPPQQVQVNWIFLVKPEADAATSDPAVALNSNNHLEPLVQGNDNILWRIKQD
jgi:hypothetical protein